MSDTYGVLVKLVGDKRGRWLTPTLGLTTKRIHASQWSDKTKAERIARELAEENAPRIAEARAEVLA